jgi:ribonucleotide reductase beta subunit family protein with ferritin-like domain
MNYFFANEKYQEVCLCVDDLTVVARSAFFTQKRVINDVDAPEPVQLPINSINLIAITGNYQNVETVKQLIAFFVSMLVYEQNTLRNLSQQLALIDRNKDMFVAQVKALAGKLDNEFSEDGVAVLDLCLKTICQLSEEYTSNIPIFCALKNLFVSANHGR